MAFLASLCKAFTTSLQISKLPTSANLLSKQLFCTSSYLVKAGTPQPLLFSASPTLLSKRYCSIFDYYTKPGTPQPQERIWDIQGGQLWKKHRRGPKPLRFRGIKALMGKPFCTGQVIRCVIKKPRKPNSANRKCVLLKLSTGKEAYAYVPGIGHHLQEHNTVLVRGGRTRDVPGLKLKVVRGSKKGVCPLPLKIDTSISPKSKKV